MINPFVLLPLYSYPTSPAWESVYSQVAANPSVPFDIIINPSNGPGGSAPDSAFASGVSKLNAYNNTRLLGYVHVSATTRSAAEVTADIDSYAAWASYSSANVQIDGIFFDEAPNDATTDAVSYMVDVTGHARSALAVNGVTPHIVLNPGTAVDDQFYSTADCIVAMEAAYSTFSSSSISSVQAAQRASSAFILHSFPSSTTEQGTVVSTLLTGEIPGIYITDSTSYNELSTLFSGLVSSVGQAAPVAGGSSQAVSTTAASITAASTATSSPASSETSDSEDASESTNSPASAATTPASSPKPTTLVTSVRASSTKAADPPAATATSVKTGHRNNRRPTITSPAAAEPSGSDEVEDEDEDCDTDE